MCFSSATRLSIIIYWVFKKLIKEKWYEKCQENERDANVKEEEPNKKKTIKLSKYKNTENERKSVCFVDIFKLVTKATSRPLNATFLSGKSKSTLKFYFYFRQGWNISSLSRRVAYVKSTKICNIYFIQHRTTQLHEHASNFWKYFVVTQPLTSLFSMRTNMALPINRNKTKTKSLSVVFECFSVIEQP